MVKETKEQYIFTNIFVISLSIIILLFTNSYLNFYNLIRIEPMAHYYSSFGYISYHYINNNEDDGILESRFNEFNRYYVDDIIKSNNQSIGFQYRVSQDSFYVSPLIKSKIMLRQDLLFKTKPRNKDEVYKAIYSDMKSCINDWIDENLCEKNNEYKEVLSPYFDALGKAKINNKTQFSRILHYKYIVKNDI